MSSFCSFNAVNLSLSLGFEFVSDCKVLPVLEGLDFVRDSTNYYTFPCNIFLKLNRHLKKLTVNKISAKRKNKEEDEHVDDD